jgi:hypothetical protein
MSQPTIADVVREFMSFIELLDDGYWEASNIDDKDFIYDINSMFSQEIAELNKLSVQDHHFPYEFITEGIRRIVPKVEDLDRRLREVIKRTKTQRDMRDVLSNVLAILESQD